MRGYAFLSYSRGDSAFALKLAEEMKGAGFAIWIDQIDIAPGERWDKAVEVALAEATALIVILSQASVESNNVNDEVALSIDENKLVIPLLRQDCKVPLRLRRLQYVDFRSDFERGKQTLARRLTAFQSNVAPGSASPPSPTTAGVVNVARHSIFSRRGAIPLLLTATTVAAAVTAFVVWPRRDLPKPEVVALQPSTVAVPAVQPSAASVTKENLPSLLVGETPPTAPTLPASKPTSAASGTTTVVPFASARARAQTSKASSPARTARPEPDVAIQGTYRGMAVNVTARMSGAIELRLNEHGSRVTGNLLVSPPLGGSGPVSGRRNGSLIDFEVPSGGILLMFHGRVDGIRMVGTYKVKILPELRLRQPNLPDQDGKWDASK